METEYKWFLGIDCGFTKHQACLLDAHGRLIEEKVIDHTGEGLSVLLLWLKRVAGDRFSELAVSLESPHGAVVEVLLDHGAAVFALNPKQLDRFRDRFTVAGAKDDRRDAYVLAASMRTDLTAFRRLDPPNAFTVRLRELSRTLDDVTRDLRRWSNQLYDLLVRYFPAVLQLSAAADDAWVWDLLELATLPTAAARMSEEHVAPVLKRYRIRRFTAAQVCAVLRQEALPMASSSTESCAEHALLLLPVLRCLHAQRKQIVHTMSELIENVVSCPEDPNHATVRAMLSIPGIGVQIATTLLAEASHLLAAKDRAGLRAYSGVAPVTKQSGKSKRIHMRRGCNQRVREACYHWARVCVQRDHQTRLHYRQLRDAGHGHARALRGVCDRLLSVLVSMLRTNQIYDPGRQRCTALALRQPA